MGCNGVDSKLLNEEKSASSHIVGDICKIVSPTID